MAKGKAVCTCAKCGATFEVTKDCYNRRDADAWEEWAEAHFDECPGCYKTRKQQEREAANVAAIEKSRNAGFPDLTGSEKQIAWAGKIRQDILDEYLYFDKLTEEGKVILAEFLKNYTDSRFWIDNRDHGMKIRKMVDKFYYENYQQKTENTDEAVSSVASV